VLRYLAARELASSLSPSSLAALRAALDDRDPRVRETAALGLAQRSDRGGAPALMAATAHERWPFVRRAEMTALGTLCPPGGGAVLARADERDLPEVRRAALEGLARCRDPRAPALLLARLGRTAEDPEMRAVAARLLGGLGDRALAPRVAEILARLRTESQADVALEGVTLVTLRALTRLGGPEAVAGVRALLDDERTALRRAAADALGTLCDAAALDRAALDRDPGVAAAAAGARRRCGK
jgi:HEAT repeat protein